MAEAMCGPSNALQQFKQQTDVDRTLQQDRLTSRHSPAQGFRSPNPHAGLLDPEFEAFQAGVEPALLNHLQPFQRPLDFSGSSQAPSWANDFQRLAISPAPAVTQQPRPWQTGAADTSKWAQGFRDQAFQSTQRAQSSSPSPQAFQQRARYGLTGFQSTFAQPSYIQPSYASEAQVKGKEPAVDQFDEAAFARAFDQAHEDMAVDTDTTVGPGTDTSFTVHQGPLDNFDFDAFLNQSRDELDRQFPADDMLHSSHTEHAPEQVLTAEEQQVDQQKQEDDALAATAQELLQKVEHNQSDKFKNSQFLGLMRKLRDREVRVEGDKMVETAATTVSHIHSTIASLQTAFPIHPSRCTMCKVPGCDESSHEFDHWESPY